MFTIENLMTSQNLRSLAVEASLAFPNTFRPLGACGVFDRLVQAGASQRVLKEALSSYPQYVEEWIRLLNAEESIDAMVKEGISHQKTVHTPSWEAIKAFEWGGYCPFLWDEDHDDHQYEVDEVDEWDEYAVRENQLRFAFDGAWEDSNGNLTIPNLGVMVHSDDFEQHSRDMAGKYAGYPVVLFSRSDEFEGCWSSWSCGTKVDYTTHYYCMVVPVVDGELFWEGWSFAPMWEGATIISLSVSEEEEEQEEEEEVLPPRFRGKVVKAAKKALHKGKKIKLAA